MAEDLTFTGTTREEIYKSLTPQVKSLLEGEINMVANMANFAAAVKEAFNFLWVGFYIVEKEQLVLGPFQGPVACTRIEFGRGVCGNAWKTKQTILVDDVDAYPGHIACSSASKSEIVIPLIFNDIVWAVLDIDSVNYADFSPIDCTYLNELLLHIKPSHLNETT